MPGIPSNTFDELCYKWLHLARNATIHRQFTFCANTTKKWGITSLLSCLRCPTFTTLEIVKGHFEKKTLFVRNVNITVINILFKKKKI